MAGLTDTLELDVADALRSIDTVEDRLVGATQAFKAGVIDAVSVLSQVDVDADATAVTDAIGQAVAAADATVDATADATAVTAALDGAVAAADATVDVEAVGTDAVTTAINDAVAAADATVEVDVQVDQAGNLAGTAEELDAVTGAASAAGGALGDFGSAATIVNTSAALATGQVGALRQALPSAGALGVVSAGLAAIGGVAATLSGQALDAEQAQTRWNRALGDSARRVAAIDVGGLSTDIDELAVSVGSSDETLRLAAADLFELGQSSGAARDEIEATTERVVALAVRAVALRPSLGGAGENLAALTGALARGGRAAAAYGLSLGTAEIEQRALADTGKRSADELTVYERAAAGAAIVSERLGDSIAADVAAGSALGTVRLRSLREEIGNVLEELGAPLAPDFIDAIDALGEPIGEAARGLAAITAEALPLAGTLLRAVVPAFRAGADIAVALAEPLGLLADLLDALPDELVTAAATTLLLARPLASAAEVAAVLAARLGLVRTETVATSVATGGFLGPLGLVAAGLGVLVGVLARHRRAQEEDRREAEALGAALREQSRSIDSILSERIAERFADLAPALREVGLTFGEVEGFVRRGEPGLRSFVRRLAEIGELTEGDANAFEFFRDRGREVNDALNQIGRSGASGIDRLNGDTRDLIRTFGEFQRQSQEQAEAEVTRLVVQGEVADATARAATETRRLSDGTVDYLGVLEDVRPVEKARTDEIRRTAAATEDVTAATDEHAAAVERLAAEEDALTLAFGKAGTGLVDVIEASRAGQLSAEAYGRVLANTGLTTEELEAALRAGAEAADAFAGSVGDDLSRALADVGPPLDGIIARAVSGRLTTEEFLTVLARTGLTADELVGAIGRAREAVESYADSIAERLPGVDDAFAALGESPGLDAFLRKVEQQARDTARFLDNIAALSSRGADDLAAALLSQGTAAATPAAQAARLGEAQLAAREAQLDRGLAIEEANRARIRRLAERHGLELVGIERRNLDLLEQLPGPDLTRPFEDAAQAAEGALDRELRRLIEQAGASLSQGTRTAFEARQRELRILAGGLGRDIGDAYRDGIEAGVSRRIIELFRAGERASLAVHAGARRGIRAESPSRLGAELGRDYVAGVAIGLSDVAPIDDVVGALSRRLGAVRPAVPANAAGVVIPVGAAAAVPPAAPTAPVTQYVSVHEVASDPEATAFAVAARLGDMARR